MSSFLLLIGLALIAVSVAFAFITGNPTPTSWIPAFLGVLIALMSRGAGRGQAAQLWGIRVVAAVGLAACVLQLVKGGFNLSSHSQQAQLVTGVLCLLGLVRSFSAPEPPQSEGPEWGRLTDAQRRLR